MNGFTHPWWGRTQPRPDENVGCAGRSRSPLPGRGVRADVDEDRRGLEHSGRLSGDRHQERRGGRTGQDPHARRAHGRSARPAVDPPCAASGTSEPTVGRTRGKTPTRGCADGAAHRRTHRRRRAGPTHHARRRPPDPPRVTRRAAAHRTPLRGCRCRAYVLRRRAARCSQRGLDRRAQVPGPGTRVERWTPGAPRGVRALMCGLPMPSPSPEHGPAELQMTQNFCAWAGPRVCPPERADRRGPCPGHDGGAPRRHPPPRA